MKKYLSLVLMLLVAGCSQARTIPDPAVDTPLAKASSQETIVFAGGCFWGVQAVFEHVKGVKSATAGYAGGEKRTAEYELVSTGDTGHAESVQVIYDPSQVTLGQLLKVFFSVAHDPTELNRQGPDSGTQYRSAIFYRTDEQKRVAEAYIQQLNAAKLFGRPIVTHVVPLNGFYAAEEEHQNFIERNPDNPYVVYNDLPKLKRLKQKFPELLKRR